MTRKHILYALLAGISLAACNKGENELVYDAAITSVMLKGYNASNEALAVKLDTFDFRYSPNAVFDQTMAYTLKDKQQSVKLTIKEENSGKLVLERDLTIRDAPARISFFYMDGKMNDMPELPAFQAGHLSMRFLFRPTLTNYSGPVDIALIKYYFTPKVFEEIVRLKNVKPNEFSEVVTLPTFSTAAQPYNGQNTSVLFRAYIYKAGTDEFYTDGSAYTWHATSSAVPLPPASVAVSKVYVFSESAAGNSIRFTKNLEL